MENADARVTARAKSPQFGHAERKSAMTIELPDKLEAARKVQAKAHGVSADGYVRELLERDLVSAREAQSSGAPFKTVRGRWGPVQRGCGHGPRWS
jgi:hypothetical protein